MTELGSRLQLEDRTQHRSVPDHRRSQGAVHRAHARSELVGERSQVLPASIQSRQDPDQGGARPERRLPTFRQRGDRYVRAGHSAVLAREGKGAGVRQRLHQPLLVLQRSAAARIGDVPERRRPDPERPQRPNRARIRDELRQSDPNRTCATTTRVCRRSTKVSATTTTMRSTRASSISRKRSEYLEAAGWRERGPDGILVKDGKRLSLRVTYGSPYSTDRLVVLREEAKKAGIELELALLDSASAFKQMQEKKHQIAWMTWASQGISPGVLAVLSFRQRARSSDEQPDEPRRSGDGQADRRVSRVVHEERARRTRAADWNR